MKKWIIAALSAGCLLTLLLCMIPGSGIRAEEQETQEEFTIEGTILRSYNGKDDTCVIPSQVTRIGMGAFRNCSLTSVTIPETVKTVDQDAFYGSKKLSRVTIEDGVASLGVSAFSCCPSLTNVVIPASVTKIGSGIFSGCTSLAAVELSAENPNYFYNDGVIYNKDSTRIIQYLPGRRSTWYEMPFTVSSIEPYAFWGATLLTDVRISNNIESIPVHAFTNCTSLTNVFLPESVKSIESYGFSDCTNLAYVGMEYPNVKVADTAFEGCFAGLKQESGVTESDARANLGDETAAMGGRSGGASVSGDSVSGNSSDSGNDKAAAPDLSGNPDPTDGSRMSQTRYRGKDQNGRSVYEKTFPVEEPQTGSISSGSPDEIGSGKISGGNALIIPND